MDKIIINSLIRRWDNRVPLAIRSVLHQSYTNWEYYILATPQSAPQIQEFLDQEPMDTSRVFVQVEEANDFVEGIRYLTRKCQEQGKLGDFFCNLDGDDVIDKEFLQTTWQALQETQGDIACCGVQKYYTESGKVRTDGLTVSEQKIWDKPQFGQALCEHLDVLAPIWGKLYRSSLFVDGVFDALPPFEAFGGIGHDTMTVMALLARSKRLVLITGVGYYYTQWKGSMAHGYLEGLERSPDYLYQEMVHFFQNIHPVHTEKELSFMAGIFMDRQSYSFSELFRCTLPMDQKFLKYYQSITRGSTMDLIRELDEKHRELYRKYYRLCYTMFCESGRSFGLKFPMGGKKQGGQSRQEQETMFYEMFLILWSQKEHPSREDFIQRAFQTNGLEQLIEERNQKRSIEAPRMQEEDQQNALEALLKELQEG